MSLTTAFPFHAFVGDLKTRKVIEHKSGVSLSLLSSEDMARIACVEVRTRCGQEEPLAPWLPVRRQGESYATFYDTRMGNFDVRAFPSQACTTCASTLTGKFGNERCTGHFGYLRMPRRYPNDPYRAQEHLYVINPHLAEETEQLLQAKCFFCHRFRVPELDVERYLQALRLLDAGLVGEALHLLDVVANARGQEMRQRRRREVNEEVISDVATLREHVDKILAAKGATTKLQKSNSMNEEEEEEGKAAEDETTTAMTTPRQTDTSVLDIRNQICKQAIRDFREFINVCSHCHAISPRITTRHGHLFFFFNKKNADFNVAQGCLTQAQLRAWEENNRRHNRSHTYFLTTLVRQHIKELCQREGRALGAIFPGMGQATLSFAFLDTLPPHLLYKVFFLDKLLVPPLPLRLSSGVQVGDSGNIVPDEQTRALSDVLGFVEQIEAYFTLQQRAEAAAAMEGGGDGTAGLTTAQEVAHEHNLRNLQAKVNEIYEAILDSFAKKEGLFRMHMMGKRVNQACRSVISPDYCVEPNEVLLPRVFARSLTYPEQVSTYAPARLLLLRRCVMNGPQIYPGATHLELRLASGEVRFIDLNVPDHTRRQHAMKYFAMAQTATLIVHRHILDHDRLVFNRQPTLHKPSMMGYRAKVLSGLKTLRFHYVNGKSYNADFDGDEMNVHVPQSLEARAELECLMDANLNYLVPTSGKPIRGLIQDHIVAGVLLTLRDKLLDHDSFVQLVYAGLAPYMRLPSQAVVSVAQGKAGRPSLTELVPVPAVLKPRPRWTGKQLISVLVHFVTRAAQGGSKSNEGVSLRGISLIQPSVYTTTDAKTGKTVIRGREEVMEDSWVQFLNSELITGVLCKNQLGPSNMCLAHIIHEVYGPHVVGELFGALGRILTLSLQREGFSMGMDDMYLVQEERRAALLRELDVAPLALPEDEAEVMPVLMQRATALQREFVPGRMLRPFPHNQLLMMTMSGAKGSNTNTIQMSLGLGQQLFDGRRVQRMNSGKTMPAFFRHERRARSFGYAMGRFASGIRPAEYTIHAMAGRDGLIDTAVKTSRSGHLQRCLIKGLESLVVHWDHSVRDANGSVIQFLYGGDGLDPMRASTLTAWEMAKDNVVDLGRRFKVDIMGTTTTTTETETSGAAEESATTNTSSARKRGRLASREEDVNDAAREALEQARVDADAREHPIPPHMRRQLEHYLECKASFPLFRKVGQVARWNRQGTTLDKLREKRRENVTFYDELLADVTARRRMRAFCDAGEPVGLLAAQAAGEPSTQMTLNTFHSAGSTVTHVTEGIPRLRELLIHGSVQKAAVIVPVKGASARDEAALQKIVQAGVAVRLADCLAVPGKSYHYDLQRGPHGMTLTVALLFSKLVLHAKAEAMCMSPREHLHSFRVALKACARQMVSILRGRTRDTAGGGNSGSGGGNAEKGKEEEDDEEAALGDDNDDNDDDDAVGRSGGLLRRPVTDPAALRKSSKARRTLRRNNEEEDEDDNNKEDESNYDDDDDSEEKDMSANNEEDDDEEMDNATSTQMSTPAIRPRDLGRRAMRPKGGNSRNSNVAAAAVIMDDDESEVNNNNEEDDDDEEEEEVRSKDRKSKPSRAAQDVALTETSETVPEDYDAFDPIRAVYGGKRFSVTISPVPAVRAAAAMAALQGTAHMSDDLFVIELRIEINQNVVAVIPDVVDRVLSQLTLSSWLPQFAAVNFTRSPEDHSSGELVFQGPSATVRNVTALISLFTVGCRAIKLRQAHSTDIADMCLALGVESGYRALYDELEKLFRRYAVDYHHLTLIADAATHRGVWENFNFTGVIAHSASPLFQMTFASSKRFLHTALTRGVDDKLSSISAAIMVGERPKVGTACVKLCQDTSLLHDIVERNLVSAHE